jgi:type VI secretion system secreted protein VgrG
MRIVYSAAGVQWGRQQIPRINQEVLVDFIEGDIDRPIIVGVLYNGTHPPPHFSGVGKLPENRTLSGIKTKEFHGQQYNELIFDDTQGEIRTRLSSEHGKTQLNQGFLIHPRKEGKGEPRGDGAELRTDRHAAIRAAEGVLLSTEAKKDAVGKQLDREMAQAQLELARTSVQELAKIATHQNVDDMEIGPDTRDEESQKQNKTPKGHLDHMVEAVKAWEAGTNTDTDSKTATGEQPGKQALLLASGVDGIGLTTPQEMILNTGRNLDTISQRDTQQTTVRRWLHNVGKKISLFVQGIKDQVNLRIVTARGHAQLHAQSGDVEIAGDQNLRLYAVKKQILVAAGEEVLLTSQNGGAYIKLNGPDIEIHCPAHLSFRSAGQIMTGAASIEVPEIDFPIMQNSESSWVKVESYWEDEWNTPWPLSNVKVQLDKERIISSTEIDHNKDE